MKSAVCGVSAIIATQGAIDADEEDSSFAIAAILALGALSLFTFPLIGSIARSNIRRDLIPRLARCKRG